MYLIFDTETTGLPKNWRAPISDTENWPRCVQLAWQVHDELGNLIESKSYIVKPDDYDIPFESEKIHESSLNFSKLNFEKNPGRRKNFREGEKFEKIREKFEKF